MRFSHLPSEEVNYHSKTRADSEPYNNDGSDVILVKGIDLL
jgi:hypothetical protein